MASGVTVNFKADTSGFTKGVNLVKGSIAGLAGTVATVMAPLAALIGAGAALGAAFKGVGLAAEMEGFEASFATILGSGEDASKVLADINKLAAQTPFGLTDLVQAARSLLSVTDKDTLTPTLKMIGDLSSASQKPLTELASMFAKIKGGDIVQGEDLNMIGDALGGAALQEFARVLGVDSVKAVRKLGSEGRITGADLQRVFENLTSKGGMAFGAMEAQSRTFNGLLSTLKDNWDGLLREFGKPIMDALKPFLQDGISLLESLQAKARSFGETVGRAITFLRNAFKGGEIVSLASSGLVLAAQTFVNVLVRGVSTMGGLLLGTLEKLGRFWLAILTDKEVWNAFIAMGDMMGAKIARAITEALPPYIGKADDLASYDSQGTSAGITARVAIDNVFSNMANAGADLVESFKEVGASAAATYKATQNVFDTTGRMNALQQRWNELSRPASTPPAAATPEPAARAATATKASSNAVAQQFQPVLSSLARIGGAKGFTSNPLVALQTKANGFLETIARNSERTLPAVLV